MDEAFGKCTRVSVYVKITFIPTKEKIVYGREV